MTWKFTNPEFVSGKAAAKAGGPSKGAMHQPALALACNTIEPKSKGVRKMCIFVDPRYAIIFALLDSATQTGM